MDYYNILSKNNQLISIIEKYNDTDEYLLFIYYTCCMLGGYESIDHLIHILVKNIRNVIYIDITLYYPYEINLDEKIEETKIYFNFYNNHERNKINKFISKLKKKYNNKNTTVYYPDKFKFYYNNTITLRGFNQFINFNKVFIGNFNKDGRVIDYFINDRDIEIMDKIIKINDKEDMIKVFKIYFQIPQLMHANKHYYMNKEGLFKDYNFCSFINNAPNCKIRYGNYNSNLITSLLTYGDCRDSSFLLEFYLCYIEWTVYLDLIKNFSFNLNKIINLIRSQNRIVNLDVYMDGIYPKFKNKIKPIKEFKYLPQLTQDPKNYIFVQLYQNKKYFYYENHNFVIKTKFKNNKLLFKAVDLMYNKYDLNFVKDYLGLFRGDYIVDNKNLIIDNNFIELGKNDFNPKLNIICKLDRPFNSNFRYEDNLKNKLIYLSNEFKIPNNFYNINKFIIDRENLFYKLRKKYFMKDIIVKRYNNNTQNISYFLMEDL
jgi:hypothetical protein